jgi:hypothetical protein
MLWRPHDRGVALIVVLLTMVLLSALGVALVLATSAETRIAGNFRTAQTDTVCRRSWCRPRHRRPDARARLDHAPRRRRPLVVCRWGAWRCPTLDDGTLVNLTEVAALANCQKTLGCSNADMDAVTEDRPWGPNNPRWTLFAFGPLRALLPAGAVPTSQYVVVMAGDDPGETDNDPSRDGAAGTLGAGILALRAEAFGPGGAHKIVELTVARGASAVRVLSWRELR